MANEKEKGGERERESWRASNRQGVGRFGRVYSLGFSYCELNWYITEVTSRDACTRMFHRVTVASSQHIRRLVWIATKRNETHCVVKSSFFAECPSTIRFSYKRKILQGFVHNANARVNCAPSCSLSPARAVTFDRESTRRIWRWKAHERD